MHGVTKTDWDFPEFILEITREIWEERQVERIRDYYASDVIMRSAGSVTVGNEAVVSSTLATLAEFPDRQLLGEDVIWLDSDAHGLLSSHRIFSTATHLGTGLFGEATGKRVYFRTIADCAVKEHRVYDEWLVRDHGAILRQLNLDPRDFVRDLIERDGGRDHYTPPLSAETDLQGAYQGSGDDSELAQRHEDILTRLFNTELATVSKSYDRACQQEIPGGLTLHGWADIEQFWAGLRASFPNASLNFHHRIGRRDPEHPPRTALRWTLEGRHEGWGLFGPPTNAPVYILGMSHAEFGPRGLKREFVLFDEIAIWKQIILKTG